MEDEERLERLRRLSDRAGPFFAALQHLAGFELPPDSRRRFLALHASLTAMPRPPLLARLTIEGGSRKDWLTPLTEAVLGHVQEGLAAYHYHLSNIELIEHEITALAQRSLAELQIPTPSAIGGGNTRRLNFEYQAFVFAARRTMEYLAGGSCSRGTRTCLRRQRSGSGPLVCRPGVRSSTSRDDWPVCSRSRADRHRHGSHRSHGPGRVPPPALIPCGEAVFCRREGAYREIAATR